MKHRSLLSVWVPLTLLVVWQMVGSQPGMQTMLPSPWRVIIAWNDWIFGQSTGMFDQKSEIVLDGQVVSVENALTIKTSELGSLRYGDAITVDGMSYRVQSEPLRMADGLLSVVSLEKLEQAITSVFETGVFVSGVFA